MPVSRRRSAAWSHEIKEEEEEETIKAVTAERSGIVFGGVRFVEEDEHESLTH